MAAFVALTGSGGSLTVEVPPRVLSRHQDGGPAAAVAFGLDGEPIVMQLARAQDDPYLKLAFEELSAAQMDDLVAVMDAGGLVTVKTYAAATGITCVFAPRPDQVLEPRIGHYPDKTRDGAAIPTKLTPWRAELTLLRME